jgi:hypothetical protein
MKNLARISIAMFLIMSSCKPKNLKSIILNGRSKIYWDLVDTTKKNVLGAYLFNENGQCSYMIYNKNNGSKREIFNFGDVVPLTEWKVINEEKVNIMGFEYQVYKISDDTLRLRNIKSGIQNLIVKSKEQ